MLPELVAGLSLRDPVRVHVLKEIIPAELLDEVGDAGAIVGGHLRVGSRPVGDIGGRETVILAGQVAVLGCGATGLDGVN